MVFVVFLRAGAQTGHQNERSALVGKGKEVEKGLVQRSLQRSMEERTHSATQR